MLPLGTMVVVGFRPAPLPEQLRRLMPTRIRHVELYPNWLEDPSPAEAGTVCAEFGMTVHSVHGVWGGESHSGRRVDLASTDVAVHRRSVEEVRRCLYFAAEAGAACLVVHPGGRSRESEKDARTARLRSGVEALLPTARDLDVRLCLENLPGRVFPGREIGDLAALAAEIDDPAVGICLDTGHCHIANGVVEGIHTVGEHLATTHLHDNDGIRDMHAGPYTGTIPWAEAAEALAEVRYAGPLILECVRWCRSQGDRLDASYLDRLYHLCESASGTPVR